MFFDKPSVRSIRHVLEDKTGAGLAEGIGGVALIMILTVSISLGISTDMRAIQTIAVKAERQSLLTSLVGDRNEGATWGTPSAPTTENVSLENGANVPVTMWQDKTLVGTTLTAVTPISADSDAANCTSPAAVEKSGCVYATRFHAGDLDSIEPHAIIRKDPSTVAAPVGTVDARVATTNSIPQGTVFATGTDTTATVWRYLLTANSAEPTGEIRIAQAGNVLAVIPVGDTTGNYFGTFSAATGVPVTVTIAQGNLVVQSVYIYRAGGTP
ncbi:MAG: hypothetical protein ABWX92_09390 [Mycetocola sp.]